MYSQENHLQHSPRSPRFHYSSPGYSSPGERSFAGPLHSPCTHAFPISRYISYPHPGATASPYEGSSHIRPWYIPEPANSGEDVQPQGEEHNHRGGSPPPLTAFRPPEEPLFTSPCNSSSRSMGDEDPGVQRSLIQRYPTSNTRTEVFVTDSRPSGFLLRTMRGEAAPPLISLPLFKPSEVHGDPNRCAPSDFLVILEGLTPRYQVGQVPRQ